MENGKNGKPDGPLTEIQEHTIYRRLPHESRLNMPPRFYGILLSDNLLRARKKCRYSGERRYYIQFRKNGTDYQLDIKRRKIPGKEMLIPYREFKNEK